VFLNNSNACSPETHYLQNSSEDELGFNYSTYPTAEVATPKDDLVIKGSNQGEAYLSSAVGGSVSQLSFKDNPRNHTPSTKGGGIRGKIRGFSRVSRRNLLRKFASINRTAFRAFKGRVFFITLTYPTEYPKDPKVCKKHLEVLRQRLEREYGDFATF
jgi:hypothetical protein